MIEATEVYNSCYWGVVFVIFMLIIRDAIYRLFPGRYLTYSEETMCNDHINQIDDDSGEIVDLEPEYTSFVPRAGGFMAAVVRLAKNEFGILDRNRANQEMVRKFLHRKMLERKMTSGDIGRYLPLATNLVFVVNQSELFAAKFLLSAAAERNAELFNRVQPQNHYSGFARD